MHCAEQEKVRTMKHCVYLTNIEKEGNIEMLKPNVKSLEEIFLEIIQRKVRIKKRDKKCNNIILYSVLETLLQIMQKCDPLFHSLRPNLAYLGSYFDRLRVGHPTEFDLNVILTLPLNYKKVKLSAANVQNGYTTIEMPSEFRRLYKTPAMASKGFKDTELWCDNLHRLSVQKFRSWMQRVVDAALRTLPKENGHRVLRVNNISYIISAKMSGPANTITICESNNKNYNIDIDLVPTLAFSLPKEPSNTKVDFSKVRLAKLNEYFTVPKPSEYDYSWRLAFPFQERFYIRDRNNLKSTLKLLKLLRDVQGFKKLASYFIKTVFLWESADTSDEFWKQSLSFLVPYMLRKLKECLEISTIQNFWCPEHNLLEKVKGETCRNWANRLDRIINYINKYQKNNPREIQKFFIEKSEQNYKSY